jgi:hypothetical protein
MQSWIILILFFLLLTFSLLQRLKRYRQMNGTNEIKISPLSLALQELIAISGGIYLSLIMLVSFLKLDIPDKIMIFELSIDPVACISILLTIIQPFFMKIFYK